MKTLSQCPCLELAVNGRVASRRAASPTVPTCPFAGVPVDLTLRHKNCLKSTTFSFCCTPPDIWHPSNHVGHIQGCTQHTFSSREIKSTDVLSPRRSSNVIYFPCSCAARGLTLSLCSCHLWGLPCSAWKSWSARSTPQGAVRTLSTRMQ